MDRGTVRIREGVSGPDGQPGFLLIAPPSEVLDWDVENEVASTCRVWMRDEQAWWIADPYRTTAGEILHRFAGPPEPAWERMARRLPAQLTGWLRRSWAVSVRISTPTENQ